MLKYELNPFYAVLIITLVASAAAFKLAAMASDTSLTTVTYRQGGQVIDTTAP